jgi:large subunit ribosomal protein L11
MPEVSAVIEGGKATAGAPLGPALGPMGVDIGKVVSAINEKTKSFNGMKVPVKVVIDAKTKNFNIEVGSPPTSALIKKELGLKKGTDNPKLNLVGDLTLEQVKKLAEMKFDSLSATSLQSAVREIIGTCHSMGVKINGVHAGEFQKKIDSGEIKIE